MKKATSVQGYRDGETNVLPSSNLAITILQLYETIFQGLETHNAPTPVPARAENRNPALNIVKMANPLAFSRTVRATTSPLDRIRMHERYTYG